MVVAGKLVDDLTGVAPTSSLAETLTSALDIDEADAQRLVSGVQNGAIGLIVHIDDEASAVPVLANSLKSANSSERAAALVDLAEEGGEEAYNLIAKSFDDPSAEVRNAAARALCSVHSDVAASFTRALREASPERRRRIGGAIAGSGLAANAINNLIGEGRDQTYDAFSILFLMAKAGEVQPLIQAIGRHANVEVRLTASKLLALSNQPQVLPALRSLAAREPLPPDVHSAVMEAIYLLSTHVRQSVPSLG